MNRIVFVFASLLFSVSLWAVKVHPEPAVITQSDGTKITTIIGIPHPMVCYYTMKGSIIMLPKLMPMEILYLQSSWLTKFRHEVRWKKK